MLVSLLAIRFNWAGVTSVAVLALLTLEWLPGAVRHVDDERTSQAATSVLIGTALFAVGAVLAFLNPSNQYYRRALLWRKQPKTTTQLTGSCGRIVRHEWRPEAHRGREVGSSTRWWTRRRLTLRCGTTAGFVHSRR
jgi:hypothetical protein